MKKNALKVSLLILVIFLGNCKEDKSNTKKNDSSNKENLYLGLKPPGLTPKPFAPDIISTEVHLESAVMFSPDMKELTFTRQGGEYKKTKLFAMQYQDNHWSKPNILAVSDINAYRERFKPSLSEIKSQEPFKDIPIIGFTVSSSGTIYFYVLDFNDGSGYLSYSRFINGKYETPQKMNASINSSGKYIAHPFISPDESYILWDAEKEGKATPDIFISFRQPDGSWGLAIDLGNQINTPAYEQHVNVTPDGKYLIFWRGDRKVKEDGSSYFIGSPYWVDAKIIETLRPQ